MTRLFRSYPYTHSYIYIYNRASLTHNARRRRVYYVRVHIQDNGITIHHGRTPGIGEQMQSRIAQMNDACTFMKRKNVSFLTIRFGSSGLESYDKTRVSGRAKNF